MQLLSPLEAQWTVAAAAAQTGCSYCWLVEGEKKVVRERACERERKSERERGGTNQKEQAITVSWCDSTQEAVSAAPGTVTITMGRDEQGVVGGDTWLHSK